jgi:SAM-dependent methyltransferase
MEWNRFSRTQLDSASGRPESREAFLEKTGWKPEDLAGKVVLDAGCGMGRFAEICADFGAEVHAVDLSLAVEAAQGNLGGRTNVHIYQADIMNLPFPDQSFDVIYSIGVLHHTPDTRTAFLKLPPLLKPGGRIAVWVYDTGLRRFVGGEILRLISWRLPRRWLMAASRVAIPLYRLHRIRYVGAVTTHLLPTSLHPIPEWRWLDTFDWYSPRYQWKHNGREVVRWFEEANLVDIREGPFPTSVRGRRGVESHPRRGRA